MNRIFYAVAAALLFISIAAPAIAQDATREAEARSVFEAGQTAFNAMRYVDALSYFRRSYGLSRRPELLFNIALCADRLRDDEMAISAYEQYLAAMPTAANEREVQGRLDALREAQRRRAAIQPEAVARAVDATQEPSTAPATPRTTPVYETWWFWTIVGVVVVGSTVGIAAAASGGYSFPASDLGGVIFTLGGS